MRRSTWLSPEMCHWIPSCGVHDGPSSLSVFLSFRSKSSALDHQPPPPHTLSVESSCERPRRLPNAQRGDDRPAELRGGDQHRFDQPADRIAGIHGHHVRPRQRSRLPIPNQRRPSRLSNSGCRRHKHLLVLLQQRRRPVADLQCDCDHNDHSPAARFATRQRKWLGQRLGRCGVRRHHH